MGYFGNQPAEVALTTGDLGDDIVTEAKMANDAIGLAELKAGTDGELITWDASGNPATVSAGTSGHYLKSQGAGSVPVFAAISGGKIGQVVQTTKTDTTSSTSTSAADISGMSVAITPSATSSKVLVQFDFQGSADQSSGQNYHIHLLRDSTKIFQGDADGSRDRCTVNGAESSGVGSSVHRSMMYLDSPSSTSELTYKLQWEVQSGTIYLNREHQDADGANSGRMVSQITVMEVLA